MLVSEYITSCRVFYELCEAFPDLALSDRVVSITSRQYHYLPVLRIGEISTKDDRIFLGTVGVSGPKTVELERFAVGVPPSRILWLAHVAGRREFVVYDPIRVDEQRYAEARREREMAKAPRTGDELPYNSSLVERLMKMMEDMR